MPEHKAIAARKDQHPTTTSPPAVAWADDWDLPRESSTPVIYDGKMDQDNSSAYDLAGHTHARV